MNNSFLKIKLGIRLGLLFSFFTFIIIYIGFAFLNGWNWAIETSSTYGLIIIRAIVVFVYALISLFLIPFKYVSEIINFAKYPVIVAFVIGFIAGIIQKIEISK